MAWDKADVFRLTIIALADEEPALNVFCPAYLFGNTPDNEISLLAKGLQLYKEGLISILCLCGGGPYTSPNCPAGPIAYSGAKVWRQWLINKRVDSAKIIAISRLNLSHTGTEAANLVALAKKMEWKDIYIVALPSQMPRAFAQTISQALRIYPELRIWCKPGRTLPWGTECLFSQGNIKGSRMVEGIDSELDRLTAIYNNVFDIAPPEKIFQYITSRRNI